MIKKCFLIVVGLFSSGYICAAPISEECKGFLGLASQYSFEDEDISKEKDLIDLEINNQFSGEPLSVILKDPQGQKELINIFATQSNEPTREYISRITKPYYVTTFIWENDAYGNWSRVDEKYTNGMKWSWLYNPCRHEGNIQKDFLRNAIELFSSKQSLEFYSGISFGMNMYTPNNIDVAYRQTNDRPYAGWAYFGLVANAIKRNNTLVDSIHTLELQIGVIGPWSAQGAIQKWWHDDVGMSSHSPSGWQYQIPNRLGVNALYSYRKNYYIMGRNVRLTPNAGFSLSFGTVMDFINAGGLISFGKPRDDYPTTTIQPSILNVTSKNDGYYYGFAGFDFRYIFYSRFIAGDGDARHDITLKHNVADYILGFAWKPNKWKTKLSYMLIYRTQEFNSYDSSLRGAHKIGQISFVKQF